VFFRSEERSFFVYGFAKSNKGNIDKGDLRVFKKRAKNALALTEKEIRDHLRRRKLIEV